MSLSSSYIWGPSLCRLLSHPDRSQVNLIFGDDLDNEQKCPKSGQEASSYLKSLLEEFAKESPSREVIDLFLESSYEDYVICREELRSLRSLTSREVKEDRGTAPKSLTHIYDMLRGLDPETRKYLRLHHVDVRDSLFERQLGHLLYLNDYLTRPAKGRQYSEKLKEAFNDLFESAEDEKETLVKKWLIVERELKDFHPLFGEEIYNRLHKEVTRDRFISPDLGREIDELVREIKAFYQRTKQDASMTSSDIRMQGQELLALVETYLAGGFNRLILYTLARMFHRYTLAPHHASRVIFYGAKSHAKRIIEFLQSYRSQFESDSKEQPCVVAPSPKMLQDNFFDDLRFLDEKIGSISAEGIKIWQDRILVPDNRQFHLVRYLYPHKEIVLLSPDVIVIGKYPFSPKVQEQLSAKGDKRNKRYIRVVPSREELEFIPPVSKTIPIIQE
jgi:hypothetical protein